MGKAEREKGKRMERRVAATLREVFDGARREWQCDGREEPDVTAGPLAVECKHCIAPPSPFKVLAQAERQAPKGKYPVAWVRRQGGEEYVAMRPDDFVEIMTEWWRFRCN